MPPGRIASVLFCAALEACSSPTPRRAPARDGAVPDSSADGPSRRDADVDAGADLGGESEAESEAEAEGASADWPLFGGDATHRGYVPIRFGAASFRVDWNVTLPDVSRSPLPPLVQDGKLAVAVSVGGPVAIHVMDATTGVELWTTSDWFSGPIAIGGTALFAQTCSYSTASNLFAFELGTGAARWQASLGSLTGHCAWPTPAGDAVFTGGYYPSLAGFSAVDGTSLFSTALRDPGTGATGPPGWWPAFADGVVYAYTSSNLWAVDASSGTVDWTFGAPWTLANPDETVMFGTVALADGAAFFVSPPYVYAVDLATHELRWRHFGAQLYGTPAIGAGFVFVRTHDGFEALDEATGASQWTMDVYGITTAEFAFTDFVVTDDAVLVATAYSLQAISLATHEVVADIGAMVSDGGYMALTRSALYLAGATALPVHVYRIVWSP